MDTTSTPRTVSERNYVGLFWSIDQSWPHHFAGVFVLHDYPGSQHNPKTTGWGHGKFDQGAVNNGHYRLNTMLDIPGGEKDPKKALVLKQSKFGLGDRRSLDDLIQFSGIDLRHKKATDGRNRCGDLQWVPFTEHPKGVNFVSEFDEKSEAPLDLPYEKTSVWYDPKIDGIGAGMVERSAPEEEEEDPAEIERRIKEEEEAHKVHKEEAKKLASSNLHEDHAALAKALLAEEEGSPEHDVREVVSNAAAAAINAEKQEAAGVKIFPPLVQDTPNSIPRGRFFFNRIKMDKHGIEHLPIQVQLAVMMIVLGLCVSIIVSGGTKQRKGVKANKKR